MKKTVVFVAFISSLAHAEQCFKEVSAQQSPQIGVPFLDIGRPGKEFDYGKSGHWNGNGLGDFYPTPYAACRAMQEIVRAKDVGNGVFYIDAITGVSSFDGHYGLMKQLSPGNQLVCFSNTDSGSSVRMYPIYLYDRTPGDCNQVTDPGDQADLFVQFAAKYNGDPKDQPLVYMDTDTDQTWDSQQPMRCLYDSGWNEMSCAYLWNHKDIGGRDWYGQINYLVMTQGGRRLEAGCVLHVQSSD